MYRTKEHHPAFQCNVKDCCNQAYEYHGHAFCDVHAAWYMETWRKNSKDVRMWDVMLTKDGPWNNLPLELVENISERLHEPPLISRSAINVYAKYLMSKIQNHVTHKQLSVEKRNKMLDYLRKRLRNKMECPHCRFDNITFMFFAE